MGFNEKTSEFLSIIAAPDQITNFVFRDNIFYLGLANGDIFIYNQIQKDTQLLENHMESSVRSLLFFSSFAFSFINYLGFFKIVNLTFVKGFIIAVFSNALVAFWNVTTLMKDKQLRLDLDENENISFAYFKASGDVLCVLEKKSYFVLCNPFSGSVRMKFTGEHSGPITQCIFNGDESFIVSASDDRSICVWREDGLLVQTLTEHKQSVEVISFSENGKFLISCGWDHLCYFYAFNQPKSRQKSARK